MGMPAPAIQRLLDEGVVSVPGAAAVPADATA
jgi:hypothetical protein